MKKKRYLIQFSLKNCDSFWFYSYSKKRVKFAYDSLYDLFGDDISLMTSNFELK